MSFLPKLKFAGFLRGLIGRPESPTPVRPAASKTPAPAPAPTPPPKHGSRKGAAAAAAAAQRTASADEIEIPLAAVLAGLPMEFRAKMVGSAAADQVIALQADMVVNQLAFGAVKITFSELRRLAPGVFANTNSDLDNKLVSLPLQEILPRMNSALLSRRSTKKVEVSSEIAGPFAERGKGFAFTTQPLKAQAAPPPPPEPEVEPEPVPPISFTPPPAVRPITPQRPIAPPPAPPAPPVAPPPQRPVSTPPPMGAGTGGSGNFNGNGGAHSAPAGLRMGPLNGNERPQASAPAPAPTPAPAPAPAPAPMAQQPVPQQPSIEVVLSALLEGWPETLKAEIAQQQLGGISVAIDGGLILPGMKRGRVVMPWKQLRMLARPGSAPSPHDNLELELPLKVLAPLFMAVQRGAVKPKAKVGADIPDLFYGFPKPSQPAQVTPSAAPAPEPVKQQAPPPAPVPAPAPVAPPMPKQMERTQDQDSNYFTRGEDGKIQTSEEAIGRREGLQTDFLSRQAQPKDIVARAVALPGVAGSVVAMADGLRVAGQVPAELSSDTVAAFLPQIFDRVNQTTRELRMGALNNVNFTVGSVPWKIFRVNSVFFAAFGHAGENLPSAQLAQLAAELDRKK